ncbi:uncharacterized protein FA14DRAFT_176268 [Meira miltonrushii]|uniref:Uncharacterized protein n=1 Tax=Meira miltonrushii TaxID=1280837 RepID=A0A316VH37_9BASI|nr:uncharacterized protein FA14DRAFT_176268 [Meira miltonrushii]PWN36967.1 hypothetical protein FA14DRAFT_176268 [Meira miltonrushii]
MSTVWSMDPANKASSSGPRAPLPHNTSVLERAALSIHRPVPNTQSSPHPHGLSGYGRKIEAEIETYRLAEGSRPDLRWITLREKADQVKRIIKTASSKDVKAVGKGVLQEVHSDMKIYQSHNHLPAHVTDKMIDKHGQRSKPFWKKITRSSSS